MSNRSHEKSDVSVGRRRVLPIPFFPTPDDDGMLGCPLKRKAPISAAPSAARAKAKIFFHIFQQLLLDIYMCHHNSPLFTIQLALFIYTFWLNALPFYSFPHSKLCVFFSPPFSYCDSSPLFLLTFLSTQIQLDAGSSRKWWKRLAVCCLKDGKSLGVYLCHTHKSPVASLTKSAQVFRLFDIVLVFRLRLDNQRWSWCPWIEFLVVSWWFCWCVSRQIGLIEGKIVCQWAIFCTKSIVSTLCRWQGEKEYGRWLILDEISTCYHRWWWG